MPAAGPLFALLFGISILGTIGFWYAIDRETDDSTTMSRADAERAARQDTRKEGREKENSNGSDEWGNDVEWGMNETDSGHETDATDDRR
jgi:hypothetical protein